MLLASRTATGTPPPPTLPAGKPVVLAPWFRMLEDRTGAYSADSLVMHPSAFRRLADAPKGHPTSYYWLLTRFRTDSGGDLSRVLSFNNLTFVDVYL
ncbi:MAG TPA: hypothetical protein VHE54_17170, partial [Puia sp.]|nr:hypothetical protein [Puia sp.]